MHHRLFLLTLLCLAACAAPLQPVLVDEAPAQATALLAEPAAPVTATAPPATAIPTVPAPATLETAVVVSAWDEATETTSILPVDPFTGGALEGYPPIVLGQGFSSARSPDGRWLATANYTDRACEPWAGGTRCLPADGVLHFIDLGAWRDTVTTVPVGSHATFIVFSADSRYLAVGQSTWPDHGVLLVDVASGALIAQAALDFYPTDAAFSADGQSLLVYGLHYAESHGLNPQPRVAALAAPDLAPRWQADLPGVRDGQYVPAEAGNVHDESVWWMPAVVFAPEAGRLYVVHADDETLTTVDFAAQAVTAVAIGPAQSWLDRLMALTADVAEAKILNGTEKNAVLAEGPDGPRLYIAGAHIDTRNGQYSRTPLGLQVVDPTTGLELATFDTPAAYLRLAPGGSHLFLTDWDTGTHTEVVALDALASVAELSEREVHVTRLVNGQPAVFALNVSATAIEMRLLDPHTFTALADWDAPSSLWLLP